MSKENLDIKVYILFNMKKVVVFSDLHTEFLDRDAFLTALKFVKLYSPDLLVINGDLVDFYGLSSFDKNPKRKLRLQKELDRVEVVLKLIRDAVGEKCKLVLLAGNHEARLERFICKNPELSGLHALELESLLNTKKYNIEFIGVGNDYWSSETGHYRVGDMLIMHGDSRLNGASLAKYAGYSAKNTLFNMQNNICIGHGHRLALIHHTTPNGIMLGLETGCLCKRPGIANWQQGFVSFELYKDKTCNPRIYSIQDGMLLVDGVLFNKFGSNNL